MVSEKVSKNHGRGDLYSYRMPPENSQKVVAREKVGVSFSSLPLKRKVD
jgi:hypothetical protein